LPAVPLPFTSDDFHEIFYRSVDELQNSPSNSDENDEEIENDDEYDFSISKFEKIEINTPSIQLMTPTPGLEEPKENHGNDWTIDNHLVLAVRNKRWPRS
jgi:hypothetical protein